MTLLVLKALSEVNTNLNGSESKPLVKLVRKRKAGRNEHFHLVELLCSKSNLLISDGCEGLEGATSPDCSYAHPGLPSSDPQPRTPFQPLRAVSPYAAMLQHGQYPAPHSPALPWQAPWHPWAHTLAWPQPGPRKVSHAWG